MSNYTSKKTGLPVKGASVHLTYEAKGVDGKAVRDIWVSEANLPKGGFALGADYVFDFDPDGSLLGVHPVKA